MPQKRCCFMPVVVGLECDDSMIVEYSTCEPTRQPSYCLNARHSNPAPILHYCRFPPSATTPSLTADGIVVRDTVRFRKRERLRSYRSDSCTAASSPSEFAHPPIKNAMPITPCKFLQHGLANVIDLSCASSSAASTDRTHAYGANAVSFSQRCLPTHVAQELKGFHPSPTLSENGHRGIDGNHLQG